MNGIPLPYMDIESAEGQERRRSLITATDMAKLANGGPAVWLSVKAEKQGRGRAFTGNRFTAHGKEREPYIMEHIQFMHDIRPNSLTFVHPERPEWAATPDGVGVGKDAEVKTTIHDWFEGHSVPTIEHLDLIPATYLAQVDWAQLVTGAELTVFAWEPHENFVPQPIRELLIPRNEERIGRLIEVADAFTGYLKSEDDMGEFDDLLAARAIAKQVSDQAEADLTSIDDAIRERAGDRELAVKSPWGSISLSWPKPRESFSIPALRAADPDTYARYLTITEPTKPTLRVTTK